MDQAGRLVRTAKTLAQAPDIDEGLRELLRQSIPEWEAQVQGAESQLCEALRLQWTDDSRDRNAFHWWKRRKKQRASRIQGNWRQSLKFRCHAHHALFRLLQSLGKPMEEYWSYIHAEDAPKAPSPGAKEFFDQVEEFIVGRVVNFLAIVFPSLQNLGYFVLAGLLLMLLAVTSYPFQPRNEFLFFNWVVILSFIGTVFWIFVQMDRDTVLSLLNDTKPGQVNFSRELCLGHFFTSPFRFSLCSARSFLKACGRFFHFSRPPRAVLEMYCQFATEERIKRVRSFAPAWSFYICATARMDGERMRNANFLPSPLWGRGWTASGVLISRGGTGEGVETVSSPHPYRKTRSLARTVGQIDKARELRRHGSRSARVVCGKSGGHGMVDSGSMGLSRLAF